MPSLLIVTEQFDVGGLETYIRGQVHILSRLGWDVYLACAGEPRPELLPTELAGQCRGLPLSASASAADLLRSTRTLREFMREHAITHVHAHPFISLFPAFLAAKLEGVPYVATLHGPSSLSAGYGPLNDFLLGSVILTHADRVIAVSEEVRSLAAAYVDDDRLVMQPNAVDSQAFRPQPASSEPARWLVVSRLDPFKIVGIRQFASLAREAGLPGIDVVGEGPAQAVLQQQLAQDGAADFVRFLGVRADVVELMRASGGVAGMGRVLLEGLAAGQRCCLVGYDGVKGMVDDQLFEAAAVANFSGRSLPSISAEELRAQLARHPAGDAALCRKVGQRHAESAVWEAFSERLAALRASPAPLAAALHGLIQSETVQADVAPYLQSDTLFYEIGRVTHGARHFSPALAASYSFYFQRAQWRAGKEELASLAVSLAENRRRMDEASSQLDALRQAEREREASQGWWSRLAKKGARD
ncbi:glycosyltransferase [Bordetella petrii]|uniref:glycosyltransferase n=1 Tax=Bordetella petrii TaxID=94624 RepID=UPI0038B4035C